MTLVWSITVVLGKCMVETLNAFPAYHHSYRRIKSSNIGHGHVGKSLKDLEIAWDRVLYRSMSIFCRETVCPDAIIRL
jgi:hypothetical protein